MNIFQVPKLFIIICVYVEFGRGYTKARYLHRDKGNAFSAHY